MAGRLVLASDIFGRTPALEEIAAGLAPGYGQVDLVDPYCGSLRTFADESQAYSCFHRECGLERLTSLVQEALAGGSGPADLVGFSVGGAAVWRVAAQARAALLGRAACFYGSRIREHADLVPACPTLLVFPCQEPGFDLDALIHRLEPTPGVRSLRTPWPHGFMNRLSPGFSARGLARGLGLLTAFLNQAPGRAGS